MATYLVHSIPVNWRVEYVRHFFSNAIEAGWFELFHFKGLPLPAIEYEGEPAIPDTHACIIRIKVGHEDDVLKRYHMKRVRKAGRIPGFSNV